MRYPRVIDIKSGNKVADYWNHRGGRFFDQPMARAFDDLAANVGRDEFGLLYQECAAGLLTRQDQHGHGEPRTCQPRKVLRVALEISKILKACPHRARLRIRPGVKSDLWHFHFYGEVPLALVKGRERIYLEHFWNDFAADRKHSVSVCRRSVDPCRVPSPSTGVPPSAGPPRRGRRRAGRWPRSGLGCWRGPVRPQS